MSGSAFDRLKTPFIHFVTDNPKILKGFRKLVSKVEYAFVDCIADDRPDF
jgi:hypothetical protein